MDLETSTSNHPNNKITDSRPAGNLQSGFINTRYRRSADGGVLHPKYAGVIRKTGRAIYFLNATGKPPERNHDQPGKRHRVIVGRPENLISLGVFGQQLSYSQRPEASLNVLPVSQFLCTGADNATHYLHAESPAVSSEARKTSPVLQHTRPKISSKRLAAQREAILPTFRLGTVPVPNSWVLPPSSRLMRRRSYLRPQKRERASLQLRVLS